MRQYLIGSWNNADSYDYSGEQLMGHRLGASREVSHFNADGSANVSKYGDNEAKPKPSSKVSIKDKILPQSKRVDVLTQQMRDLVSAYKAGEMDINEYSLLLDILSAKKDRAEVLLKKALAQKPVRNDDAEPIQASVKPFSTTPAVSPKIKQKASQLWLEAKVFWGMAAVVAMGMLVLSH